MTDADIAYYRQRMERAEHRCAEAGASDVAALYRRMAESYRAMIEAGTVPRPCERS